LGGTELLVLIAPLEGPPKSHMQPGWGYPKTLLHTP